MKTLRLPDGENVPALGQGTWFMGERADQHRSEVNALRHGLDLGMTLIDTAEMYGEGGAEKVVGEAMHGRRDEVFLVSKVYPHNASRQGVAEACAHSLKRLGTDRIDLYLLHWPGSHPLAETVEAFERLRDAGHIRHWGVSNFDTADMKALHRLNEGCATNQVLYNLTQRGPEWDLLPWCQDKQMPVMAYSPIEQGRLPANSTLNAIASRHGVDRFAIALAWVLSRPEVIAIPKSSKIDHLNANHAAAAIVLSAEEQRLLDHAFQPPTSKQPLAML